MIFDEIFYRTRHFNLSCASLLPILPEKSLLEFLQSPPAPSLPHSQHVFSLLFNFTVNNGQLVSHCLRYFMYYLASKPSRLHYVILTSLPFQDAQNIIWTKWEMWSQREKSCRLIPREATLKDSKILSYIKKCIQVTWRMVTQVPAPEIEYQSVYLSQQHKKMGYHSSPEMFMNVKTPT